MPELVSFMKICERGDSKSSNCENRIADATCVRSTRVRCESKLDALTYKVSVDEFYGIDASVFQDFCTTVNIELEF